MAIEAGLIVFQVRVDVSCKMWQDRIIRLELNKRHESFYVLPINQLWPPFLGYKLMEDSVIRGDCHF